MPIYEYHCDNCGENFDAMQKFADQPLTHHEKCNGGPVHRLISAPAFHLKGSGWYVTDYANKSGNTGPNGGSKASESSTPAAAKTELGSSSSSDSSSSTPSTPKPAATSDTK